MRNLFYFIVFAFVVLLQSCSQKQDKINQETKDAAIRYAQESQKILGKGLMGAIKNHDLTYAISFCSDTAEILTQSISTVLNVKMKRVSDKNRNPNNAANTEELAYISKAKSLLLNGKALKPEYRISGDSITAYIPIMTKPICLNCHGEPANMKTKVISKIIDLYPNDKALDYKDHELRGIWVVEMKEVKP
jgi:hypothetical protein